MCLFVCLCVCLLLRACLLVLHACASTVSWYDVSLVIDALFTAWALTWHLICCRLLQCNSSLVSVCIVSITTMATAVSFIQQRLWNDSQIVAQISNVYVVHLTTRVMHCICDALYHAKTLAPYNPARLRKWRRVKGKRKEEMKGQERSIPPNHWHESLTQVQVWQGWDTPHAEGHRICGLCLR